MCIKSAPYLNPKNSNLALYIVYMTTFNALVITKFIPNSSEMFLITNADNWCKKSALEVLANVWLVYRFIESRFPSLIVRSYLGALLLEFKAQLCNYVAYS